VLRGVLEVDATGHHALVFGRLRQGEAPRNRFEVAFKQALDASANRVSAAGAGDQRPSLQFRGVDVGIAAPPGADRISVEIAGRLRALRRGQFVPLATPWPPLVRWTVGENSGAIDGFRAESELLVFDPGHGRLLKRLDANSPRKVEIDAAEIAIAGLRPFTVNGEAAGEIGSGCFLRLAGLNEGPLSVRAGVERGQNPVYVRGGNPSAAHLPQPH
jgi:hypothetical protein